ncbi:hypothetical protein LTR40_004990 [Exophiala xenobiotica]|nr:hypothetical protein LTR40_004990 [Exophiala xenobiotica]
MRDVMSYNEVELSLSNSRRRKSMSITSEETLQSQSSSLDPLDGVQAEEEASEGEHEDEELSSSAALSDDESDDDATHSETMVKEEDEPDMGSRPKVVRKTVEDCTGWSASYQAEWERYGVILPAETFAERDDRRKKRKMA